MQIAKVSIADSGSHNLFELREEGHAEVGKIPYAVNKFPLFRLRVVRLLQSAVTICVPDNTNTNTCTVNWISS